LREFKLSIPVIGIAKGIDRKKDELIFDNVETRLIASLRRVADNVETQNFASLRRLAGQYKDILVRVRDEAHRFAIGYHRQLRGRIYPQG